MKKGVKRSALVLAVMLGLLFGVGLFTFSYGKGFSYFSSDPRACVNCHIMQDEYNSWQHAPHHTAAACIDCHLPHEFIPKMIAKTDNGWRHSKAFTLQNFHEPIQITPRNARILQDNCLRCHGDLVHEIVAGSTTDVTSVTCVHCHASVGHGPTR